MSRRLVVGMGWVILLAACVGEGAATTAPPVLVQAPPGAEPFPASLAQRLASELASRGESYQARTRHHDSDGAPSYTNRLLLESSPYLRQHAHNPVNWYPWGEEAFEAARRLKRPVLLSIGYSTCHWCHVMEEESFEDPEIARYLNGHYIAIKVDREERPDLDAVYMSAVQMMTGRGGWPMTTWLTPEREPFFGGTYFPARDGDRGTRKGFLTLLRELRSVYDEQPDQVAERAKGMAGRIRQSMAPAPGDRLPGPDLLDRAVTVYASRFDAVHGGSGSAPKFPSSLPVRLLLRHHHAGGENRSLEMALLTLEKMAGGGIHDQIGGGFHRYSTDAAWLVPHFEKMLYDNALLAAAYLDAYQLTGRADFRQVVDETLAYVAREMTSPEGGFYSATDADSPNPEGEREEGWFFTWTPAEIRSVLGPDAARLVELHYGVTPNGNFEGRNILHVARPLEEVTGELGISGAAARKRLATARRKLYQARSRRPAPLRDDKILASWNGLMISAFARAGFVLHEPGLVEQAAQAASFVLEEMLVEGRLFRVYAAGRAQQPAFLDDHAFMIAALLDLYESSAEARWLEAALSLQAGLDERFADRAAGGYFSTGDGAETLLAREKPGHDGAEPSGNSVALLNLLRFHELTGDDRFRQGADRLLQAFQPALDRAPNGFGEMLLGLDFRWSRPLEIVVVTPGALGQAEPFLEVLRQRFEPNAVRVVASEREDLAERAKLVPLLSGRVARDGAATAYLCQQRVCQLPTTDPERFARQLSETVTSRQDENSADRISPENIGVND